MPASHLITTAALADWLDKQGDRCWWTVDGDVTLQERVHFPCPSSDLATALRAIHKRLVIQDPPPDQARRGRLGKSPAVDDLVIPDPEGNRCFLLRWEHGPKGEWLLTEDKESAELASTSEKIES